MLTRAKRFPSLQEVAEPRRPRRRNVRCGEELSFPAERREAGNATSAI